MATVTLHNIVTHGGRFPGARLPTLQRLKASSRGSHGLAMTRPGTLKTDAAHIQHATATHRIVALLSLIAG